VNSITGHLAPGKVARITGGFYLAYIVASVLATALGQIGLGAAPQVYQAIVTNEGGESVKGRFVGEVQRGPQHPLPAQRGPGVGVRFRASSHAPLRR
jgi:hypothetical protein